MGPWGRESVQGELYAESRVNSAPARAASSQGHTSRTVDRPHAPTGISSLRTSTPQIPYCHRGESRFRKIRWSRRRKRAHSPPATVC